MDAKKIRKELIEQKGTKFKGNIYHYSQVNFAYNSNKIEGSKLSEEETESVFNTESFIPKSDDLIEMKNHFRLFDFILDNIDIPLDKELLIKMYSILKRGTSDEDNPRYNVDGFKVVPNIIGLVNVINTSSPDDVENDLDNLLKEYDRDRAYLVDTILNAEDIYDSVCNKLLDFNVDGE